MKITLHQMQFVANLWHVIQTLRVNMQLTKETNLKRTTDIGPVCIL